MKLSAKLTFMRLTCYKVNYIINFHSNISTKNTFDTQQVQSKTTPRYTVAIIGFQKSGNTVYDSRKLYPSLSEKIAKMWLEDTNRWKKEKKKVSILKMQRPRQTRHKVDDFYLSSETKCLQQKAQYVRRVVDNWTLNS